MNRDSRGSMALRARRKPLRVGLIGLGSIGLRVAEAIKKGEAGETEVVSALVRDRAAAAASAGRLAIRLADSLASLLADRPDIVVECAGHAALRAHGAVVLR